MSTYNPASDNILEETVLQKQVSDSTPWRLSKQIQFKREDSSESLKRLGFAILGESELFFEVTPPEGFTKKTEGYWTEVFDENGKLIISQFYKAASWDTEAFLKFFDK